MKAFRPEIACLMGVFFGWGNDGVSLTPTPPFMIRGRVVAKTWLARRGLLRKDRDSFRSQTSRSIYIHRSLNGNWTHLRLLKKEPARSASRSLLILGGINEIIRRSFLSLLSKQSVSSHRPDGETPKLRREARPPSPTSHVD